MVHFFFNFVLAILKIEFHLIVNALWLLYISYVFFPKLGLKLSNFCCSNKVSRRYHANIGKEHTTVGSDYYLQ